MQSMFKGDVERTCTRSVTKPPVFISLITYYSTNCISNLTLVGSLSIIKTECRTYIYLQIYNIVYIVKTSKFLNIHLFKHFSVVGKNAFSCRYTILCVCECVCVCVWVSVCVFAGNIRYRSLKDKCYHINLWRLAKFTIFQKQNFMHIGENYFQYGFEIN